MGAWRGFCIIVMTRYLFKYDSVHGEFKPGVRVIDDENIEVANGENIKYWRYCSE